MKKILISLKNNSIIFSYKTSNSTISNDLINTNIISNNELVFSDIYIKDNYKILSSFIKELAIQYNVNKAVITNTSLASFIIRLLDKANSITSLLIKDDEAITYTICECLINIKHIKKIECYTIQSFMLEMLDKNNITCTTRSEILYISNFMEKNNLISYSNIYYKSSIRITLPLSLEDLTDFEDFCKINKYLKNIHVNKLIATELESLLKVLKNYNRRNIKIIIHENISDEKTINTLKELNKSYKKHNIYLTLEYSKEYLDKNLFTQTITNMLKVCGLIISSLVILVITYIGISNYVALKEVNAIKDDLESIVKVTNKEEIKNKIDEKNEENLNNGEELGSEDEPVKLITNEKLVSLLGVNDDIVGELKVNNTNVDYPVVQASDNDFYLKRDINQEESINGWIFMDYRNNPMNLDKNTIIYGHNMYYSGVMFGTLHKAYNKNWYTNPDNQIITYNTLYENLKFKIFSIYKVPKTNDYLKVYFNDDADFLNFIGMLRKRSVYQFDTPVDATSKILTLSTCSDNGSKRLVIHGVLVNE